MFTAIFLKPPTILDAKGGLQTFVLLIFFFLSSLAGEISIFKRTFKAIGSTNPTKPAGSCCSRCGRGSELPLQSSNCPRSNPVPDFRASAGTPSASSGTHSDRSHPCAVCSLLNSKRESVPVTAIIFQKTKQKRTMQCLFIV